MQINPININSPSVASGSVGTTIVTPFSIASGNTYAFIQNISSVDMFLGIGFNPTTSTGILIKANGGSAEFSGDFLPAGAYNLISVSGSSNAFTALYA